MLVVLILIAIIKCLDHVWIMSMLAFDIVPLDFGPTAWRQVGHREVYLVRNPFSSLFILVFGSSKYSTHSRDAFDISGIACRCMGRLAGMFSLSLMSL